MTEPRRSDFRLKVEEMVSQIPIGRVMTYGQLAALAGQPRAAQQVGGIAHYGDPKLPWQRVVNRYGGLAAGYPGGRQGHQTDLIAENIKVKADQTVDLTDLLWWPSYKNIPLLVIVGQTATGKSDLAMRIASHFNGEIICADSLTVRREVDIGSAKPGLSDRDNVTHHLVNIVYPCQPFSVAQFKVMANQAINDVKKRGKLPILVGGSGLYIDSVLYNYSFRTTSNQESRNHLNSLSLEELQREATKRGIDTNSIDANNFRRLIRLIETGGQKGSQEPLRSDAIIFGLSCDKETLKKRIKSRVNKMMKQGLEIEVKKLSTKYGWDCQALASIGYREWQDYLTGQKTLIETHQLIIKDSLDLARRQATWFKQNKSIQWFPTPVKWSAIVDQLTTILKV